MRLRRRAGIDRLYKLSELPRGRWRDHEVPFMRGHVEQVWTPGSGPASIVGWAVVPETPVDAFSVWYDGVEVARVAPGERPDVGALMQWIPHAAGSGLTLDLDLGEPGPAGAGMLEVVALRDDRAVGMLTQLVRADLDRFPSPPEEYMHRVVHTRSPHFFKVGALKTFGDFVGLLNEHSADWPSLTSVLDWGCGCGRLAAQFLSSDLSAAFHGADIDLAAVQWCRKALGTGTFVGLEPLPPMPYDAGSFDLVTSYSVLTHLTREVQDVWLEEVARVLRPGGWFITTTHGDLALSFAQRRSSPTWPDDGFWDASSDPTLDGIAPPDYYRATYQSEAFSGQSLGRYFDVIDYVPAGASSFQDLILLRKP